MPTKPKAELLRVCVTLPDNSTLRFEAEGMLTLGKVVIIDTTRDGSWGFPASTMKEFTARQREGGALNLTIRGRLSINAVSQVETLRRKLYDYRAYLHQEANEHERLAANADPISKTFNHHKLCGSGCRLRARQLKKLSHE